MSPRLPRENAFLVGAVALPLAVIGLFLLLTAIPRWTVPPPQHDLLLQTAEYERVATPTTVELFVRDEVLHATLRVVKDSYSPRVRLWRYDHATLSSREVPLNLPIPLKEGDPQQTVVVEALRGHRILTDTKAPDGYQMRTRHENGPGPLGDIFGMGRYGHGAAIVNRGRVMKIEIPGVNRWEAPAFVGWVVDGGGG